MKQIKTSNIAFQHSLQTKMISSVLNLISYAIEILNYVIHQRACNWELYGIQWNGNLIIVTHTICSILFLWMLVVTSLHELWFE